MLGHTCTGNSPVLSTKGITKIQSQDSMIPTALAPKFTFCSIIKLYHIVQISQLFFSSDGVGSPLLRKGFSLVAGSWGHSLGAVCRLLTPVASLITEHMGSRALF